MGDMIFGDDAFADDSSSRGDELNFNYIILRQLERCSFFLSKLDETPAYIWAVLARPETNLKPENHKPHKSNFVHSVLSLETLLYNNLDKDYHTAIKKIKELHPESKDIVSALKRYRLLVQQMKRAGLLPAERK